MDARKIRTRFGRTIALLALYPWITSQAAAVDFSLAQIDGLRADLHLCGAVVTGSADVGAQDGVGINGGWSSATVDGSEWIDFDFDEPQRGVRFDVGVAYDLDGDGISGRTLVEAFDASGASLGFQFIQGHSVHDLGALYGPTPMSRVRLTAIGDGIRLENFGYDALGTIDVDLRGGGDADPIYTSPTVCGVHMVGSSQVYYEDSNGGAAGGLGVVGGASHLMLDGSEWVRLEFPFPVDELVLDSQLHTLDGDFWYGEAVLFAYDASGSSLGSMSIGRHSLFGGPLYQSLDVADSLGVSGIAEIEIYSLGDARRLDRVRYAPEPTVGAVAALLALAALARRRSRSAVEAPR